MFYVGQKVVCVSHPPRGIVAVYGEAIPRVGGVFTIREIIVVDGVEALRLVEIVNPPHQYANGTMECVFRASRFRPIVERKTDISIFKAMLNPSKQGVEA